MRTYNWKKRIALQLEATSSTVLIDKICNKMNQIRNIILFLWSQATMWHYTENMSIPLKKPRDMMNYTHWSNNYCVFLKQNLNVSMTMIVLHAAAALALAISPAVRERKVEIRPLDPKYPMGKFVYRNLDLRYELTDDKQLEQS